MNFPAELLDAVAGHLDHPSLASLARTCCYVHSVAQRQLYRHIDIHHNSSVVLTLSSQPSTAKLVRSFSFKAENSTFFQAFYAKLATALSFMTELLSLELVIPDNNSWVLPQSGYYRLQKFVSAFAFDASVSRFLDRSPELVQLELSSTRLPSSQFNDCCVPKLVDFVGSAELAELMIPGRAVQSIHLASGNLTDSVLHSIACSAGTISILTATTPEQPVSVLTKLSIATPQLVFLRIMSTCDFAEPPDVLFYENVAHALSKFPNMQAFELSGMHWGSDQRGWQSKPLEISQQEAEQTADDDDIASDLFFQY